MRGIPYNLFGSQDEDNFTTNTIEIGVQGAQHWFFRVRKFQADYSFSNGVDRACADSLEQFKSIITLAAGNRVVTSEEQLVTIAPDEQNAAFWDEYPGGGLGTTFESNLCKGRTRPVGPIFKGSKWQMGFSARCSAPVMGFGSLDVFSFQGEGLVESGSYELIAIDPITFEDYTVRGPMFSAFGGVTGTLTIRPNEYYSWDDPDGVPLYNVFTGELVTGD